MNISSSLTTIKNSDVSKISSSLSSSDKLNLQKSSSMTIKKTAFIYIPPNFQLKKLDRIPITLKIPIFIDTINDFNLTKVWIDLSTGSQGDQTNITNQTSNLVKNLEQNGFNDIKLIYASMSGLSSEMFINNNLDLLKYISDIILISGVNHSNYINTNLVNVHYISSPNDTTVPTSCALQSQNLNWKSKTIDFGVGDHNHILNDTIVDKVINKTLER